MRETRWQWTGGALVILGWLAVGVADRGQAEPPEAAAAAAATPAFVCPMSDGGSAEQYGNCPRCGMALVAASTLPPPHPAEERPPAVAAYVCSRGDGAEDVAPGTCPRCGAEMVLASRDLRVGVLIFPGVQIIDYTGPFEAFGQGGCRPFTVAKTADPITTAMGMKVTPAHSFADCPPMDVLVIPGGGVDTVETDPEAVGWLRERAEKAQFVLSVCNGAFILARTGLLDGLTATTFYDLLDDFALRYPKVRAVRDRRYVDNGKFVTTAGISSGIDGSLHVIEKLRGRSRAQRVALNMEYDWKPTADYARASFADHALRRIFDRGMRLRIVEGVAPLLVRTEGDKSRWVAEWRVATPMKAADLLARLDATVESRGPWKRAAAARAAVAGGAGRTVRSHWRFEDLGGSWRAVTEVESEGAERHRVRVRVERG